MIRHDNGNTTVVAVLANVEFRKTTKMTIVMYVFIAIDAQIKQVT